MLVRATTTFHAPDNVTVNQGDLLNDSDDLVTKYPSFFVPAEATATTRARLAEAFLAPVEDTTSRPGARRGQKA